MTSLTVLLTNDDGIESPFFQSLVRAVVRQPWCKEPRAIVPAEEKSWVAQAMSRHNPVFVSEYPGFQPKCFTANGTPADCVSLGVHTLFPTPPDLVISGINIGTNAGLAFYLSSGTVGAARQGFLCGVPSIAFSVALSLEVYDAWYAHDLGLLGSFAADFDRIAEAAAEVTGKLLAADAWRYADLFTVNLPWEASASTEMVLTELEHTSYKELFRRVDKNEYIHQPKEFPVRQVQETEEQLPGDMATLARGKISVTPIKYDLRVRNKEHLQLLSRICEPKA